MVFDLIVVAIVIASILLYMTMTITLYGIMAHGSCVPSAHGNRFFCVDKPGPSCYQCVGRFFAAPLWPIFLPVMVAYQVAAFAAKGPVRWGTFLSDLSTGRSNRAIKMRERIAELEQELLDAV